MENQVPDRIIDVDAVKAVGFGLAAELHPFASEWHHHAKHQVFYAASGLVKLESEQGQWWVPPRKAAWIRAGEEHCAQAEGPVSLRTVYLDASLVPPFDEGIRVFFVEPLAREMFLYAMRFGANHSARDDLADDYFRLLARLVWSWAERAEPFRLPSPKSPEVRAALDYAQCSLESPLELGTAARHAAASERTLQRRLQSELGLNWRELVQTLRMLRAMELLALPGARVTETAYDVGMESVSAFSRAFKSFVGKTPKEYQQDSLGG